MIRFQGVSLPGFGVSLVAVIVFALGRNFFDAWARVRWSRAGLAALALWFLIDLACILSMPRKRG